MSSEISISIPKRFTWKPKNNVMAAFLPAIASAVNSNFKVPTASGRIKIEEDQPSSKIRVYEISANLPHVTICLDRKRNKGTGHHPAFSSFDPGCSGICSCVDSIVICHPIDDDSRAYAFLIELKSKHKAGATNQMRSARAFLRWLIELLQIHHQIDHELQYFGVVVLGRRIPLKGTTRRPQIAFKKCGSGGKILEVCEWSSSYPLHLSQLLAAVHPRQA